MPQAFCDRRHERSFGAAEGRSHERGGKGGQPDDRDGQRVLRSDERSDSEQVVVTTEVLEVLLDEEAERDDREEEEPHGCHPAEVPARPQGDRARAESHGAPPQPPDAQDRGDGGRHAGDGKRNAGGAPIVVRRMAQRADESLSRPELHQEDGVVADEQRRAGQGPEPESPQHPPVKR